MSNEKKAALGVQTWAPLLAGLVGVLLGGVITIATVERQIQVGQEAEQRATRSEAYLTLTETASNYANNTRDLLEVQEARGPISLEAIDTAQVEPEVNAWLSSRHEFQNALNQVYIYGSTEGWDAAVDLAAALPYARGEEYEWVEISGNFADRYNQVLTVICEEGTISPRPSCTTQ